MKRQDKLSSRRHHRREKASGSAETHLSKILADALIGLLIAGLVLLAKWGFEQTLPGEQLEQAMYEILQLRLAPSRAAQNVPVVVDITGIPITRASSHERDYTSRASLQTLLDEVAAQHPRAVGIDVDFTPYSDQFQEDSQFLNHALQVRNGQGPGHFPVPVYVAVHDSVVFGPALCLGSSAFEPLAAFAGFPNPEDEYHTRKRMVDVLEVKYRMRGAPPGTAAALWQCPSLGSAVAAEHLHPPQSWLSWAIDFISSRGSSGFSGREFLVDFSPLEAIENQTVSWNSATVSAGGFFRDRMVFFGRGSFSHDTGDKYPIPGRRGRSYSGVYVHACAAYTLRTGALYALNSAGRIVLDAVVSVLIIAIVAAARGLYPRWARGELNHRKLQDRLTFAAVLGCIVVGYFLVNWTRFLWDDFFYVALALILHRAMDARIGAPSDRLAGWLRALVFTSHPRRPEVASSLKGKQA